jgi:hypothetical protein
LKYKLHNLKLPPRPNKFAAHSLNAKEAIIMEKLKMHSPNFVDQNIAKIAELFPNCVTESRNDKANYKKPLILIY